MRKFALLVMLLPAVVLAADSLPGAKTQVKTSSKADVQAQQSGADSSTIANVLPNNTTPGGAGTGGEQVLSGNVQTSAPTYTSGNLGMPWLDTAGRMHIVDDGQLPASLGAQTMANSLSVTVSSNQTAIPVTSGALSGIANARAAPVSIASAGTTAIVCKASLAVSQPFKLLRIRATGAAMARCTARYNDNGSFTNFADLMVSPGMPKDEVTFPVGAAALTTSATATTQQIELNCTNFDAVAQDFGCDVSYCQAASGC